MSFPLEYHVSVRHSIPASVALLGLLALPAALVATSQAQVNGAPASVTSPGFGGRAINGPPPSVTSVGRGGYAPNSHTTFETSPGSTSPGSTFPGSNGNSGDGHHHHHHDGEFPAVVYTVPVPYAVDSAAANTGYDADDEDDYQGGPTVFDRRGSGEDSYVPPVRNVPMPHAYRADADSAAPEPPQPPTLLVFKDGHTIEVGNYAIVGATLFDLTPGHSRKVALADLDLEATSKQNDDRGISFQLPPPAQAN